MTIDKGVGIYDALARQLIRVERTAGQRHTLSILNCDAASREEMKRQTERA